jgi:hypothetical protein
MTDMNANWEYNRFLLSQPEVDQLLGELCTRLGFCSATDECTKMLQSSPLTIDEFTDAVLAGEGCDTRPDYIHKQVRSLVADYYAVATNHGLWWLKFSENRPEDVGN